MFFNGKSLIQFDRVKPLGAHYRVLEVLTEDRRMVLPGVHFTIESAREAMGKEKAKGTACVILEMTEDGRKGKIFKK